MPKSAQHDDDAAARKRYPTTPKKQQKTKKTSAELFSRVTVFAIGGEAQGWLDGAHGT